MKILKKLCGMKHIQLIEGKLCKDHVHIYVDISPKLSVSEVMLYVKGKSSLMIFDLHPEFGQGWGNRHFWARGYYVATVDNVNESTIVEYIKNQEE